MYRSSFVTWKGELAMQNQKPGNKQSDMPISRQFRRPENFSKAQRVGYFAVSSIVLNMPHSIYVSKDDIIIYTTSSAINKFFLYEFLWLIRSNEHELSIL
jgi:hypothetical protein